MTKYYYNTRKSVFGLIFGNQIWLNGISKMQMMQPFKLSKLRSLSTHRKYTHSDNPRSMDNCF